MLPNMAPSRNVDESDASMRQRLVNSLSQSFPGSALSRALHSMDSDDEIKLDPLSSSCFSELRLDKGEIEDDELTSLTWLQDTNLIKNINAGEDDERYSEDGQKENNDIRTVVPTAPPIHPPHVPYNPQKHINSKPPYSFSCLIFMAIEDSPQKSLPVKDIYSWILKNFPYFQNAPTGWKNSVRHNLSLNKCFKKVEKDKGQSIGKGSLWCIDPDYRPNLLQALRKTPYHPYQLQMLVSSQVSQSNGNNLPHSQCNIKPVPLAPKLGPNSISPHLFPFLSKRLAQSKCDLDSDIQDVAYTLMSMKGLSNYNSGPGFGESPEQIRMRLKRKYKNMPIGHQRKKPLGPVVCTNSPSEDHTYSATTIQGEEDSCHVASSSSSIDDEYDFGPEDEDEEGYSDFDSYHSDFDESCSEPEDTKVWKKHNGRLTSVLASKRMHIEEDEDEEKKIAEGADALLNLAGIKTSQITCMRSISPLTNSDSEKSSPVEIKTEDTSENYTRLKSS